MKKKVLIIFIIVLVLILLVVLRIFGRGIYYYAKYQISDGQYFGNDYGQLIYPLMGDDKKQASEIMTVIDKAFSFIGTEEDAHKSFGKLSRYCVTEDAATETHSLNLVTADFQENEAYLWFVYSAEAFDKAGILTQGSQDILVRLSLQKHDNQWMVTDLKEHP